MTHEVDGAEAGGVATAVGGQRAENERVRAEETAAARPALALDASHLELREPKARG
jgi:hypothetical protein